MRIKNWESALNDVLARHRALPFAWGTSDCAMFPLAAIVAITGADPWPGLHGYDSRLGAARCLTLCGYGTLADAFADKLVEIAPAFAQRGDVGVVQDGEALCGVLFTARGAAGKAERGLVIMPRDRVLRAFRVN